MQTETALVKKMILALQFARPSGAVYTVKIHGSPMQRKGLPDIMGCYAGYHFGIEAKVTPGEEPTKIQSYVHDQIRAAGGIVVVAYTVKEALDVLSTIDQRYVRREQ